ncbi:Rad9-domain-containing protein [Amylocystis lapponica]|nr:Rad9-domain-containing protein [Amylocystis lapponica]
MQATLDSASLKHLTRALLCLSKYGDDLTIYATSQKLSLSAMNSSLSAYCRFKYERQFFSRYTLGDRSAAANDEGEESSVIGQLNAKALLSILKHKTVEKTVEKCELSIADGDAATQDAGDDEDRDMLESRLTVRLHCKHGVVKTHRLNLSSSTSLMAPRVPDTPHQSQITIGAKALKDMIEHFPSMKGSKSDPQLIWRFEDIEVHIKSFETAMDTKGKAHLATEVSLPAAEFDVYDVHITPSTIAFHLREFNATIAFAESASTPLEMRFTDPAAPLFIDLDDDLCETLFVIATSQAHGSDPEHNVRRAPNGMQMKGKKRPLEDDSDTAPSRSNSNPVPARLPAVDGQKPMKVVQAADRASLARELNAPSGSMGPPSLPFPMLSRKAESPAPPPEPLFLPGSQLSQAAEDAIRESGLGIENMTADEFAAMLEGDGEEVGMQPMQVDADDQMEIYEDRDGQDSLDIFEEFEQTQNEEGTKIFKPLFED